MSALSSRRSRVVTRDVSDANDAGGVGWSVDRCWSTWGGVAGGARQDGLDTNMGIVGISCRTLDPGLDATMNKSIGRRISPDGEHETGCKLQIRVCQFDSKY